MRKRSASLSHAYTRPILNMGKSQSKEPEEDEKDGTSTMTRAIARGRVYLILRYPKSAEEFDGETTFTEDQFRYLMLELQKVSMMYANDVVR